MSTVIAEIVGFLIVLAVLYRYVLPPLRTMVGKREDELRQQVDDARKARERLDDAENSYQEAVESAENDAARIRDDARADAEQITQEIRRRGDDDAERIKRRGEEAMENARLQTVRGLKTEMTAHSGRMADRLVRQELGSDQAKHSSVDSFLQELERSAPRQSGGGSSSSNDVAPAVTG